MERRDFIKTSCNLCLLGAAGCMLPQFAGCSTAAYAVFKTTVVDNKLSVPLSLFDQQSLQVIRPQGWYYDIAVEKNSNQEYRALLLQCTHQENQLTPDGRGFHCSVHGSEFDKNGQVVKGPAEQPLIQYRTFIDNNTLFIEVPSKP